MKKGWTGWMVLLTAIAGSSVSAEATAQSAKDMVRENRMVQEVRTGSERAVSRRTDSERVVSGRVLDENRKPIAGALITIPGRWDGAATDRKGRYRIVVPKSVVLSAIDRKSVRSEAGSVASSCSSTRPRSTGSFSSAAPGGEQPEVPAVLRRRAAQQEPELLVEMRQVVKSRLRGHLRHGHPLLRQQAAGL